MSAHLFDGGEVAIHLRAVVVARNTRQPGQSNLLRAMEVEGSRWLDCGDGMWAQGAPARAQDRR